MICQLRRSTFEFQYVYSYISTVSHILRLFRKDENLFDLHFQNHEGRVLCVVEFHIPRNCQLVPEIVGC